MTGSTPEGNPEGVVRIKPEGTARTRPVSIACLAMLAFLFAALPSAASAIPQVMTFQGVLKNSTNSLLTGTYSLSFRIQPSESGWSQFEPIGYEGDLQEKCSEEVKA